MPSTWVDKAKKVLGAERTEGCPRLKSLEDLQGLCGQPVVVLKPVEEGDEIVVFHPQGGGKNRGTRKKANLPVQAIITTNGEGGLVLYNAAHLSSLTVGEVIRVLSRK